MKKQPGTSSLKLTAIIVCALLSSSCATSVGLAASAVTSATISVGTAVVKAPFKLAGMVGDDDEEDSSEESND